MKTAFAESDVRSTIGDEEMLSVSHITGVTPRSQKNVNMFLSKTNVGQKKCQPGDIVINTMWAWMAALGVSEYDGIVSPSYGVYHPTGNSYNSAYLDYLLRTEVYRAEYVRRSTGINLSRLRLYPDRFLSMRFICPPRAEQEQIVRYLDWKVSQVNKLINARRRQIALLGEMVDNLTNRTINETKNRVRLKHLVEFLREPIVRNHDDEYKPVGVLNRGRGVFHKQMLSGGELGDSEFFHTYPNALLISGQFAWEGSVALTEQSELNCITSHRYYTIRAKEDVCCNEYLWAYFQTKLGDTVLNLCSHGAAGRNKPLNFGELQNEFLPLPDLKSQRQICTAVQGLMGLRRHNKEYENLLHEYRTRLISDVVTGKIDVHEVAVPEYETVEDVATADDAQDEDEPIDTEEE